MTGFKGAHMPEDINLYDFFRAGYGVSYRDLKENMREYGVKVDNAA